MASEEQDPDSILAFYKMLVQFRKDSEIVADGEIRFLDTETDDVIAYERTLKGEKLTVVCSMRGFDVPAPELAGLEGRRLLISNYVNAKETGVLRPYEARVIG